MRGRAAGAATTGIGAWTCSNAKSMSCTPVKVQMSALRILDAMGAAARRNVSFDWSMTVAGFWTVAGLFSDVAYHIRHHADSFFTIEHGMLYSGLVLLFGLLVVEALRGYKHGARGTALLPEGYMLSLLGVGVFFLGGVSDMAKHEAFGFERDFDALLSPTHLLIAIGMVLAVCGPLRAALYAPRPQRLLTQLPAIISTASVLELLHMATHPFFRADLERMFLIPIPHEITADAITLQTLHVYEQGSGLVAFLFQSLLMTGAALYLVRNFKLRAGALTTLFLLGNVLVALSDSVSWGEVAAVVFASVAAGITGDVFLRDIDALRLNRMRFAAFAFAVPAAYHAALVIVTALFLGGIWWNPSVAAGAVIESGLFGLFLGFVAFTWQQGVPSDAA
jgi:hypothetical protein